MSKLAAQDKFLDLSDYGRPLATLFAQKLKNTQFTPIHVTLLFGVSGGIAIYCILQNQYYLAGFFIILKSIIDKIKEESNGRFKQSNLQVIYNDQFFNKQIK